MSRRRRNGNHGAAVQIANPRAVGYVRVSTRLQDMSPEVQIEKIRALAELQDSQLVEIVRDKQTAKEGSIDRRPGIQRILSLIEKRQVDRVYIAKLDRLTRSIVDAGALLTRLDRDQVGLISATETWLDTNSPTGRLLITMIVAFSQLELELISERTSAVLQFKKVHNEAYNHPVYGMRLVGKAKEHKLMAGKRLVADPQEQAVIAKAKSMRKRGATLQAIADKLNTEKVRTKGRRRAGQVERGKWYPSTVRNILLN